MLTMLLLSYSISFGQIKVMSYNIRYDNPEDGENNWHKRKVDVTRLLKHYQPGIFGVQEGLVHQLDYIDRILENYVYVGVGRDDGKKSGEYAAIFYDTSQYVLLKSATFWLSETPETVSIGWDASMERICTYGKFRDTKTRKEIWVFNAHYDHLGEQSRIMASKLILAKITTLNENADPIILMGDFNSMPNSEAIIALKSELRDAAYSSPDGLYGPKGTFNSFEKYHPLNERIDYIFIQGLQVYKYMHIDDRRTGNLWVSDHLPVLLVAEVF